MASTQSAAGSGGAEGSAAAAMTTVPTATGQVVSLLDYGAGNVQSIRNAITSLGYTIRDISSPADLESTQVLVFPGVGAFGSAMEHLETHGYADALRKYISEGKPFLGICIGLQCLFEGSEETPGVKGLGVIKGVVGRFPSSDLSVPHIGWNGLRQASGGPRSELLPPADHKLYFVHSYRAVPTDANKSWVAAVTDYGSPFISIVENGLVSATQCHPEKSGPAGLSLLSRFFERSFRAISGGDVSSALPLATSSSSDPVSEEPTRLARRIVACLDVRSNEDGDLVVTKGDQYDVRTVEDKSVRNLGKPVELAARYYQEGADEVTFLNITAFRSAPLEDQPMLAVLEAASSRVFVPLTVGGGIRGYTDSKGVAWSALDVAARYFRAGADKISIGGDAVLAAEEYYARGRTLTGDTAIEQIAAKYGSQAVVISVDPKRVWVSSPDDPASEGRHVIRASSARGPGGEEFCWYQCTIKGGREARPLDAHALAQACEALGAGELLVNCIDQDGQCNGYDLDLIGDLCSAVSIPVIASSGAGKPSHFTDVFRETRVEAALAAGIFHRKEVAISEVKSHLASSGVEVRP